MKRLTRPLITLGLSLLLALFSAALTYSTTSRAQVNFPAETFFLQTTPAPPEQDQSEIGSTDEIVAMTGVIVIIVVLPILLRRKSWR